MYCDGVALPTPWLRRLRLLQLLHVVAANNAANNTADNAADNTADNIADNPADNTVSNAEICKQRRGQRREL